MDFCLYVFEEQPAVKTSAKKDAVKVTDAKASIKNKEDAVLADLINMNIS